MNLINLQRSLDVSFSDPSLLDRALIHGSYINENPSFAPTSNERLEFLGDAILGMVVAEMLYQGFPYLDEGEMTKLRAALVRRETLARVAINIGLGSYLYLGRGEESSGGRVKPANLASALEAVIAAIFLDQGANKAGDFILRLLSTELKQVMQEGAEPDYKTRLQEFIQARDQKAPTYHLVEVGGPEHGKTFIVEVRLGETTLGRGSGKSKKAAETEAARSALEKL